MNEAIIEMEYYGIYDEWDEMRKVLFLEYADNMCRQDRVDDKYIELRDVTHIERLAFWGKTIDIENYINKIKTK